MNDWSEGYFTDSTYTYGYYRELSPNFMRWCLLLKGIAAPEITEDSCHCELGYGQGLSANIHAAATPGKFFGTDFHPAHAAQANEFVAASGANAKFFEDSFEEFSKREDLPQFDSIGFHGTWTWVSAENRRHMLEVARRHLKSGGMLYNSYNCLPGWAPNSPLRELLVLHDKYQRAGNADERVAAAFKFVGDFIDAEPAYADRVPSFKAYFEDIRNKDAHYIAHEYLNLDWDLMYFADVAELCREFKLDFAMSAIPLETNEGMYLSEKAREFLNGVGNPIMREQLKDYFTNRRFRKDIFVRGVRRLSRRESYEKIFSTRYVLIMPAANVPMKVKVYQGELNLNEERYRPLLEFLERDNFRPKDLREFLSTSDADANAVIELITLLVHAGHVMPCQSDNAVKLVKRSCERLNAYICERANFGNTIKFLASPLTGCGVEVGRFQQIFLAQYKAGNKTADKIAEATWRILANNGERMTVEVQGESQRKVLETPEENLAHLKTLAENFLTRLPIMKALLL